MKKMLTIGGWSPHAVKKALLVMKLTFLLVFVAVLQVSANVNGQGRVSLSLKQVEISKALNSIEKQGEYRFLYNSRLTNIRKRINLDVRDMSIVDVLKNMFVGTDLTYKILEHNLIVVLSSGPEAQDIRITGKVTGDNGEPLSGVSITVKGTSTGTSTDNDGNFVLTAPEKGRLVFSNIGFETQEVAINSLSVINIKLTAARRVMDEVVVIGYGQATKRDLTGSIVKVDGKEVQDKPNTNPIASLQSKVAGLSVVNNGTPGKEPDIRIRGTSSIGNVHPLYVVDGIFNDNIDYLNPNDIESIEILKDPSSLAIFGVRGATGVIAITTKKAKAGQTVINFNTSYGFKDLVNKIKFVNASEFNTLFDEENANNGVATPTYPRDLANTDWIDAVTRTAHFNANNLSISSSTDRNKFTLGLGYTYDEGIVRRERLKKIMASVSDEVKLTKNIKVGVIINATRLDDPYNVTADNSGPDVLNNARKVMPQVPAGTIDQRLPNPYNSADTTNQKLYYSTFPAIQSAGVQNPLIQLENEWDKTINIEYRAVGSVYGEVNFLKYFTFRASLYDDLSNADKRVYTPLYNAYNASSNPPSSYLVNNLTGVKQYANTYRKAQQDYVLNFKKEFGDHNVTATGGFTTYYSGTFLREMEVKQSANGAPIPNDPRFWYINAGFVNDQSQTFANLSPTDNVNGQNEYTTVSWLGRVLYNYQQKYFLNASFRDDASSRIPEKNRHQQFWAVGAAWDLSKENFMKDQNIFDFLKVKGSIGVLGNQSAVKTDIYATPINYPAYPNLLNGANAVFGNNLYSAATPEYLENPNLKWETVSAQEIGFELNAFQNKLHFEANYFNKNTKNLMIYVNRAPLGLPNELINGGELRNWGEEFSATWNQQFNKDFSLSIGGNITFMKNKVISLSPDVPNGYLDVVFQNNGEAISETKPGQPIGYFKGMVVEGVFQSYADIIKSPPQDQLGTSRPGDLKYKDVNGDGVISYADRTYIGNPSPKFNYGASINLTWKGLNLSTDVGGVYGNQVYRTWGSLESPFQRVNYAAFQLNRWHGPGTSNWVPLLSQGDRINYIGSTYSIESGSYFRIRNLQLGYNFPKSITGKTVKNLRVYVNVQNLKTWKNNNGYTAEFGGTATAFGYDDGSGAIPRVTTMGLNVTF
jgi:TonB-linked SusC/RagA family outer membrane protein